MSRAISTTTLSSMLDAETGDYPIVLLTIDHDDLAAPIYVSSDATQRVTETDQDVIYGTVSRSTNFLFYPFDLVLPSDEEDGSPQTQLQIDNIDAQITDAIRELTSPPTVLLEVVMASDPDTVEMSAPDFLLTDVEWDRVSVTGTISMDTLYQEKVGRTYRPGTHPGCFA